MQTEIYHLAYTRRFPGLLLLLTTLALTPAVSQTNTAAGAPPPTLDTTPFEDQVRVAIDNLGANDWALRDSADDQLRALGKQNEDEVLKQLLEIYAVGEDPEIQHRAQDIIHEVVINQVFHQKKGYMGVQLALQRLPVNVNGIEYRPIIVEQVMPNTAAKAARLLNGDKIIKIDHNLCSAAFGVPEMIRYISGKAPGTRVRLMIWSGGKEVAREVTLRQRPNFPTDPPEDSQKEEFFKRWLGDKIRETRERLGLPPDSAG